jgi:ribonuclease D
VPPASRWLDSDRSLHRLTAACTGAERIAVDLEGDGFHRYPEHIALLQFALPSGEVYLVDPLSVSDLEPIGQLLSDQRLVKVMHSADFDIRSLDRDYGFRVRGLYDTSIAAQYCGEERTGLAKVTEAYLGRQLNKSTRLQRLDWSRRPLSEAALAYAAGDVTCLLALADALAARIAELRRTDWVAEECQRLEGVRYTPPEPPEEAFLALRGARALSGRRLAILRELFIYRDGEARRRGRPPYRVLTDEEMLELTLRSRGTIPAAIADAIDRGHRAEPVVRRRSPPTNPWTTDGRERLGELKRWRRQEAARLGLGPGLVWPAVHLEAMALHPGSDPVALDRGDPPWVRRWQWRELGPSLSEFATQSLGGAEPEDAGSDLSRG